LSDLFCRLGINLVAVFTFPVTNLFHDLFCL
jgi:hypothetical protein